MDIYVSCHRVARANGQQDSLRFYADHVQYAVHFRPFDE